jgi:hypothetical protein
MSNKIVNNDPCNEKLLLLLSPPGEPLEAVQAPDDKVYPSLHAVHLPTLSPVPSVLHPKRQVTLFVDNKYPSLHTEHSPAVSDSVLHP